MLNNSLFDAFTRNYESRRETDMSIADYLSLCKKDPMAYANATERLLAAIGEPEIIDTAKDRVLLPACRPGPGRAQTDPLPARSRRRWQVFACRAPEAAHGG